jgi:hypothetical protein
VYKNARNTGSRQTSWDNEMIPVELFEVSESPIAFDSSSAAASFLNLNDSVIAGYVRSKVKIIKSKKDGKVYLIKRLKGPGRPSPLSK